MKVIASHNGLEGAKRTYELLRNGAKPLEACVAGIQIIEDDPAETTVGYGGVPNELGIVELDAAVMDGKTHRGAGVAALRNVRHPSAVALKLAEQTNRCLLVGEGALLFARANGFKEEDLLTDYARRIWLHWKRVRSTIDDWRTPADSAVDADVKEWFRVHFRGPAGHGKVGTIHIGCVDAAGDVACCTSTSGHAFKLPGRVGDSPILGAGLFADNHAGTCGSIGHGEANLENLSSHGCVERMRAGMSPADAGLSMLRRIAENTRAEQCDEQGRPKFNLWLFLLAKDGRYAGVTMWGPKEFAIVDERGGRLEKCLALFEQA